MNVYIPIYLFILLFCLFVKGKNSINIKLFVSLGLIFLMMAFRTNWGGDYEAYENWFDFFNGFNANELAQLTEDETRSEIGYRFLCLICPSFRVVLIVSTLFYCITLYFFFKEFIPEKYFPYAFTFLFFDKHLLMGSSSIRTAIAVCFFLIAVILLARNRNKIWSILSIAIGSLFHTGILILLPIVLIRLGSIRISKQFFFIFSGFLAVISIIFANQIVAAADYLTSSIGIFNRYEEYLEETVDTSLGLGVVFVIMEIIMLIPLIDISSSKGYAFKDYTILKLSIVWVFLMIAPSFGLSERLFFYLDYLILAAVPIVHLNYSDKLMANIFKYYLLVYYFWIFSHFLSEAHFVAAWAHYNF